jgi:hypothetical protein
MPLEDELRETFSTEIERLIDAARETEKALAIALKKLIRKRFKDVRGNLEEPSLEFWQQSERRFRELLSEIHRAVEADADTTKLREGWLRTLSETANRVFDRQTASLDYRAIAPGQLAEAWNGLQRALRGPKLRGILQLPKPRSDKEAIAS